MKFAKMSGKVALIALAAVCLLVAPALSMPMDNGLGRFGHGGMFALMNNLTAEEMGNMTLGELKEMQLQAWNNTTACLAKEPGENCRQLEKNADGMRDKHMRGGPMDEKCGHNGAFCGKDDNSDRCDRAYQGKRGASPILLLMDDLTVEDLNNMTLNQIKDLSAKKMLELENMTLNQIKELQEKKVQERDNMTLSQLKDENKNMQQMARILGGVGIGYHFRA
jgi:hypothetical protein